MVPGKPEESYLMEVIQSDDPEISMPPKGDRLFDDEIEILRDWIAEGAVWPGQMNEKVKEGTDHWAFQSIVRPELPWEFPKSDRCLYQQTTGKRRNSEKSRSRTIGANPTGICRFDRITAAII